MAKKKVFPKKTLHLRIRRMNQSSSGLNPQKVLPSPPKSHGSVTSMGLFGSRSYWPLPIIIRSRRRNLRLQNCFPRFCDLQQQQVLAGVFFLLLLIMSRMLRVVAVSICATQLNITRLQFLVFVPYFPFFFLSQKYHYSPNGNGISGRFVKDLLLFPPPKRNFPYFCPCHSGRNRNGQRKRILRFVP